MALSNLPKIRIIPPGYTTFENEEDMEETVGKDDSKVNTSDEADGITEEAPVKSSDPTVKYPDLESDLLEPSIALGQFSNSQLSLNLDDSQPEARNAAAQKRVNPFVNTMRPPKFTLDTDSPDGVQRQDSTDGVQRFVTQQPVQGWQPSQDGWQQGSPAGQGPSFEWHQDTLSCWKSPGICIYGTFCGPCLFCRNASDLGSSGCWWWCLGLLFPMTIALRSTARAQLGVQGSYLDDVVTSILCSSCVNCQVASQIKQHKERGYKST